MKPAPKSKGSGLRAAWTFSVPARLAGSLRSGVLLPAGLFHWRDSAGFLAQMSPGYGGGPSGYRGRLVINYPILLTVLLVLAIAAVLLVGVFLYYRFLRSDGSLEKRVGELERALRELYRKQQSDLDGVLRHLHPPAPKSPAGPEEKPDLEKDTCVGRKQDKG